jgi:hypothetical protein
MIRKLILAMAGAALAAVGFASAASASAGFVAVDTNGSFATTATVTNGEVVTHDGLAHTVVSVRTSNGVTEFHLTNPLPAGTHGALVFVS